MPRKSAHKSVSFRARIRGRTLDASKSPLVMGIVNVTPDSFFDGGRYSTTRRAIEHALKLADEGAEILDIGGESTRPGARCITTDEELRRVVPVIEGIRQKAPRIAISIDTMKARVAEAALEAGADIVNDVSGLSHDPGMRGLCARASCYTVIMHRRSSSKRMYAKARYRDVTKDVATELASLVQAAIDAGIRRDRIVLDPGIGFSKLAPDSWKLIMGLSPLISLGFPVLCGWSRKSFLKEVAGDDPGRRLAATLALIGPVINQGVSILRVHDVAATKTTLRVLQAVENANVS